MFAHIDTRTPVDNPDEVHGQRRVICVYVVLLKFESGYLFYCSEAIWTPGRTVANVLDRICYPLRSCRDSSCRLRV